MFTRTAGVIGLWLFLSSWVMAAPAITSFSPPFGGPGVSVTISGSGFDNASSVLFNNVSGSIITSFSGTRITATVPAYATTGKITVTTPSGSANSVANFIVTPRVDAFSPSSGLPGQSVTVSGLNFKDATNVSFSGVSARYTVVAEMQISAVVPTNAPSGYITVSSIAGTGESPNVFVMSGTGPIIDSFEPNIAKPGASVVISGGNFIGATTVQFNGVAASFGVTADTQIQAIVPATATTGPIKVITPKGTNVSSQLFTVLTGGPAITGFTPTSAAEGTMVTINGLNFANAKSVWFNGVPSPSFGITSDSQILAIAPANAGTGPIRVATLTGTNTSSANFTVLPPGPQITSFTPTNGVSGAQVLINGVNFTNVTGIRFGATNAVALFGVSSATQIHAIVPTNAVTGPISVLTLSGTNNSAQVFRVLPPGPVITSLLPANGAAGETININGQFLSTVTNVQFNGASASFGISSDAQIRAVIPTNATSGPITVISPTGTNVSETTFSVAPFIFGFSPTGAVAGTSITITGLNFSGATSVKIGLLPAAFNVLSLTNLTFLVPSNAVSETLSITTPAGIVATTNRLHVLPKIDGFTPLAAPAGTLVEINGSGFSGATGISFGGVAATSFSVASVNRATATVPVSGKTGVITLVTPEGSTVSSNSFTVAVSGELSVTMGVLPVSVFVYDTVTNIAIVTNSGPSTAGSVTASNHFSFPVQVVSAKTTLGSAASSSNSVIYSIGALPKGSIATLTTVFRLFQTGTLTNRISVATTDVDPILTNNFVEASMLVKPFPLPTLQITRSATNQIAITWPIAFTNFYLQASSTITGEWSNVTAPPATLNDVFRITFSVSPTNRFYRLRRDL